MTFSPLSVRLWKILKTWLVLWLLKFNFCLFHCFTIKIAQSWDAWSTFSWLFVVHYFYAQLCFSKCDCLWLSGESFYFFHRQWTVFYQKIFLDFSWIETICQCLSMTFLILSKVQLISANGRFSWVASFSLLCVFQSARFLFSKW